MLGDDMFGTHVRLLGRAHAARGLPVFLYHFTRVPPSRTQTLGAFHGAEVAFVFDSQDPFFGEAEGDRALTQAMGAYWTNFAKTGDPNGPGLREWPAYGADRDRWLVLGDPIEAVSRLRAAKLDVMERALRADLANQR
jgi:para-nitrobenzyl esterase